MKRPNPEFNAGVKSARQSILRAIRRGGPFFDVGSFIKGMPKRAAKKAGGAGRK